MSRVVALCLLLYALPAAAAGPTDGVLTWASARNDGRHEVYVMTLADSAIKRLTQTGATYPTWSPDGKWISYYNTAANAGHMIRPDGSGDKKICDGYPMFWTHGTGELACDEGPTVFRVNVATGKSVEIFKEADLTGLGGKEFEVRGMTHDGRYVLGWSDRYRNGYTGDNGTFKAFQAAVIFDLQDKSKIYYFGDGCEPTTPPAGDLIYHVRGDGPTHPDIYRMSIKDLPTRASYEPEIGQPDADWGHEYNPRISNDNKWLAYVATTGCHDQDKCDYEVFIHRLGAGATDRTRLTNDPANDQWPHLFIKSAAPPPADSGAPVVDAGTTPNPDAGVAPKPDSGSIQKGNGDSGCVLGGKPASSSPVLVLLLALLALVQRRKPSDRS